MSRFRPWPWCRCCRMGPPLGALPPMRMTASWPPIPHGSKARRLKAHGIDRIQGCCGSSAAHGELPSDRPAGLAREVPPSRSHRAAGTAGFSGIRRSTPMTYFGLAHRPGAGRFFDRLPVHRSESPPGYSSAGCSPAEPASALPGIDMIAHSRPAVKNRLTRRAPYKGGKRSAFRH